MAVTIEDKALLQASSKKDEDRQNNPKLETNFNLEILDSLVNAITTKKLVKQDFENLSLHLQTYLMEEDVPAPTWLNMLIYLKKRLVFTHMRSDDQMLWQNVKFVNLLTEENQFPFEVLETSGYLARLMSILSRIIDFLFKSNQRTVNEWRLLPSSVHCICRLITKECLMASNGMPTFLSLLLCRKVTDFIQRANFSFILYRRNTLYMLSFYGVLKKLISKHDSYKTIFLNSMGLKHCLLWLCFCASRSNRDSSSYELCVLTLILGILDHSSFCKFTRVTAKTLVRYLRRKKFLILELSCEIIIRMTSIYSGSAEEVADCGGVEVLEEILNNLDYRCRITVAAALFSTQRNSFEVREKNLDSSSLYKLTQEMDSLSRYNEIGRGIINNVLQLKYAKNAQDKTLPTLN